MIFITHKNQANQSIMLNYEYIRISRILLELSKMTAYHLKRLIEIY